VIRAAVAPPRPALALLALALLALLAACAAPPAPRPALQRIVLSRGLAADYSPLAPTEHFSPDEPFYCAALFTGLRPGVLISARWLYRGDLIRRTDYVVQQSGNGYVGFELSNASPPWPAGEYQVEILVDHQPAGRTVFAVAAGPAP
jgi:hypothetical protein